MDYEEHREAVRDFIDAAGDPDLNDRDLEEACYSVSELGVTPNGMSIDASTATQCWKLVEAVRQKGFPEELRM